MELNIIRIKFHKQIIILLIYSVIVSFICIISRTINVNSFQLTYLVLIPLICIISFIINSVIFILRPLYKIPSICVGLFTKNEQILKKTDDIYGWILTFSVALLYVLLAVEIIKKFNE